jgi:hypothetical protein
MRGFLIGENTLWGWFGNWRFVAIGTLLFVWVAHFRLLVHVSDITCVRDD